MNKNKLIAILAVAATTGFSGCSKQQNTVIPLTCEGIATGMELVVKYESKFKDEDLTKIDKIRAVAAPYCTAEAQPTLNDVQKGIIVDAAKQLTVIIEGKING